MNVGPLPVALGEDVTLPVAVEDVALDTPAMLVDLQIVRANIERAAKQARRAGLALRPHIKTHKSPWIAGLQRDAGATGLCVATVGEAEVMASHGFDDITVGYPIVGERKLARLAAVCERAAISLVADSEDLLGPYGRLASRVRQVVPVLVEVDTGMHRVGVAPDGVVKLAHAVETVPGLRFAGIFTHAGHAHSASDAAGVEQVARLEARTMAAVREQLEVAGFDVAVVSAGSSLTAPYLTAADGITEMRPGTYVYNDLRTLQSWSCRVEDIAARMLVTVVSVDGRRMTVDAGNKTLTPTVLADRTFGHVLDRPDLRVTRLSEEHGVLDLDRVAGAVVGDRLQLLPVHVCAWTDLQPEVYGVEGSEVARRIAVTAMRHSL